MKEKGGPSSEGSELITGENFVMGEKKNSSRDKTEPDKAHPLQFRPGESTDRAIEREEAATQAELERTKDFTDADHAEELLRGMLEFHETYSETLRIKSDGTLDTVRVDGIPVYLAEAKTLKRLYQIAKEIEDKHPEYHFSFENDPEGKWIKYSVSKTETGE